MNLIDKIEETYKKFPNKSAVQMKENGVLNKLTYKGLREFYSEGKALLKNMGIKPGNRIALISENRPEWVASFLSIIAADATVVVLDYRMSLQDLKKLIYFADVKTVILSGNMKIKFEEVIPSKLPQLNLQQNLSLFEGSATEISEESSENEDENIAVIMFTSGTIGKPKGVMLTHEAIIENTIHTIERGRVSDKDKMLSPIPLSHIFGLTTNCMVSLFIGATNNFLEKLNRESLFAVMNEEKITVLFGVPRLYESINTGILQKVLDKGKFTTFLFTSFERINKWMNENLGFNFAPLFFRRIHKAFGGNIQLLVSGGASLSGELWSRFQNWGFRVMSAYGLTETGPGVSTSLYDNPEVGTVGLPMNGIKVKIADPDQNGQGEICIATPSIMKGYFRNPEATQETIVDGWFYTGDLGQFTKKGNLKIFGRKKEVIVTSSGMKIVPEEVEKKYQNLRGVKEMVVLGVMTANLTGEEIHAVIVPEEEVVTPKEKENIKRKIELEIQKRSTSIPSYMHIQHLYLADVIPKTTTMKPKRLMLAKQISELDSGIILSSQSERALELNIEIEQRLLEVLYLEFPKLKNQQVKKTSSLTFDLGIDSLGLLDLGASLRKEFDIQIDETQIATALTFEDLAELIQNAKKGETQVDRQELRAWSKYPPITSVERSKTLLASSLEEWMWGLIQQYPENPAYSVFGCYDVLGDMDVISFKKAIQTLFKRHEILRTTYENKNGVLLRKIHLWSGNCNFQDMTGISRKDQESHLSKQLDEIQHRCFDPSKLPLFEVTLIRLSPEHYVLVGCGSHLIFDAVALGLMLAEISYLYRRYKEKGHSEMLIVSQGLQYADFALWQKERHVKVKLQPLDTHFDLEELKAGTLPILLRGPLYTKLQACCHDLKILLPTFLVSTLQVLLFCYFQRNVAVNTVSSGRYSQEVKSMLGLFMQNMCVSSAVSYEDEFRDIARANQEKIMSLIRTEEQRNVPTGLKLNIVFNCITIDKPFELDELEVIARNIHEEDWYVSDPSTDLYFRFCAVGSMLIGKLNFKKDRFDDNSVALLLEAYIHLLQMVVEDSSMSISQCSDNLFITRTSV